ncbi:hypothetical protein EOE67_07010 [Rheinheimera riviphila]|uniref:Uncharacterized protein n=1 Tax=Rheinheimera riviphila TaxID=1834037 RepID=A0A437R0Q8_9GAMM|nr:hypothetical protein [Rheinheimera riviphila]RVU40338.1 hypothetical protein EOE67_07010 [Rheinheimera riviphila]
MKLFNAQSNDTQVNQIKAAVATIDTLESKVLVSKDLLATVAGGVNEVVRPWPPTDLGSNL